MLQLVGRARRDCNTREGNSAGLGQRQRRKRFAMGEMMSQYISEADFDERWGARVRTDGNLFTFDEVKAEPPEHVWTVVESGDDADGNWYAAPGFHVVNRLGYVLTRKRWVDGTRDAIYFLDEGGCEEEHDGFPLSRE